MCIIHTIYTYMHPKEASKCARELVYLVESAESIGCIPPVCAVFVQKSACEWLPPGDEPARLINAKTSSFLLFEQNQDFSFFLLLSLNPTPLPFSSAK